MQTTATYPAAYSEGVKSKLNYVMVTHLTGKPEYNCWVQKWNIQQGSRRM